MTIRFSKWTPWSGRNKLAGVGSPGVYLIAESHGLQGMPSVRDLTRKIIYIGCSEKPLRSRLNSFNRACTRGNGHQAGRRYFGDRIYPDFEGKIEEASRTLLLNRRSAIKRVRDSAEFKRHLPTFENIWRQRRKRIKVAIWCPTNRPMRNYPKLTPEEQLKFVEARLQVQFVKQHQRLPKYNRRFG